MTTEFPTLCRACKRLRDPDEGVCTSFPRGIPVGIFVYGEDHRRPIAGEAPFDLDPDRRDAYDAWVKWFAASDERTA